MHDLDLLLSEAQDAAAAMLNAMGSVAPMVMFITPAASPGACKVKGTYMGALGYQPSPKFEEKLQIVSRIGGYLRSVNATAYAHLAECWASSNGHEGIRPSKDPERKEIILIVAQNRTAAKFRTFEINRTGAQPRLGKMEEYVGLDENNRSIWDGLLNAPSETKH